MTDDSKYCWQCRLISGGGLIGASAYVLHHGKKLQGYSNYAVRTIGYGIGLIGGMRLLGFPPFHAKKDTHETSIAENEDDEYIIGKFPSKFN